MAANGKQKTTQPRVKIVGYEHAPSVRADGVYAVGALPDGTIQVDMGENILVPSSHSAEVEVMIKTSCHLRVSAKVATELVRGLESGLKQLRELREKMKAMQAATAKQAVSEAGKQH